MNIEILQCRHKGFAPAGRAIRLIQGTTYSHYAFRVTSMSGTVMVIDATTKNFSPYNEMLWLDKYIVVNSFDIDVPHPVEEVMAWFEKLYGTPYATLQLLGIKFKIPEWGYGIKKMTCNEAVLRFLNRFTEADIKNIDILDLVQTEEQILKVIGV